MSEGKRVSTSNLSTSITPTGWIHVTIDPKENETSFEGSVPASSPTLPPSQPPSLSYHLPSKSHGSLSNGLEGANPSLPPSDHEPSSNDPTAPSNSIVTSAGSCSGGDSQFLDSLPVGGSPPSQSLGLGTRNWYLQVWRGIVFLASDPFPEVADLAQQVVHSVHDKVGRKSG